MKKHGGAKKPIKKALRYLSYRQRSKKEIINFLTRKGYRNDQVEEVLDYLDSHQLVDDHQLAEDWINYRSRRGNGSIKLRYELQSKGIDERVIDEKLDLLLNEEKEYQSAKELLEKRLNKISVSDNGLRLWQKMEAYLKNRGFPPALVENLVREYRFKDNHSQGGQV